MREGIDDLGRFAAVTQNRISQCQGLKIMHISIVRADSPQRSSAHLFRGDLSAVLDDAVASSDVVQQKIAKGMNVPKAQCVCLCLCDTGNQRRLAF